MNLLLNNRAGSNIVYASSNVNEYTRIGGVGPLYDALRMRQQVVHMEVFNESESPTFVGVKYSGGMICVRCLYVIGGDE